jgi:MFS family permease
MSKKQLFALFVCSLVVWTVGNGLIPLLPVYAMQLGAVSTVAGYYLSFSYLAVAVGTVVGGWLSDKLQRRKTLLMAGSVVAIPAVWLMGRAPNAWYLTAFTAMVWFLAGMQLALVSILAGLFAQEAERGKVFGILSLTGALGSLVGGATTGPIADRWGYPVMFAALALLWSLSPLTALLLEDKVATRARDSDESSSGKKSRLGGNFFLLLVASLAAGLANFVALLGRSLVMNDLGFSAAAISSTTAISGAVALPLPPLIGWLSDRVGRKRLLAVCYLAGTAGLLVLPASVSLWHFWVAMSLMRVSSNVSRGVGSALATDLAPQEALGRGMSLFSAMLWVGAVIGFASTGYAVQNLGTTPTFVIGASLSLIAVLLLILIRQTRREAGSAPHSERTAA